jgi:hypothetical protein
MLVSITTLADHGSPLPGWRHGRGGVRAQLVLGQQQDSSVRIPRARIVARAQVPGGAPGDLLPPLFDARIVYVSGRDMLVVGVEQIEETNMPDRFKFFAQEWWCSILDQPAPWSPPADDEKLAPRR